MPLNWRLFLPPEWADDAVRRWRTRVAKNVGHRGKWRPAPDALDELATRHLVPPIVVADAGYGQNADFRAGLAERGHAYVVGCDLTVQPHDAHPAAPGWSGTGRPPMPRYRQPPAPVAELAAAAGREAFGEVTWRAGPDDLPLPRGAGAAGRSAPASAGPGDRGGRARPVGRRPAAGTAAGRISRQRLIDALLSHPAARLLHKLELHLTDYRQSAESAAVALSRRQWSRLETMYFATTSTLSSKFTRHRRETGSTP